MSRNSEEGECMGPLSSYPTIQEELSIPSAGTADIHICMFEHGASKTTVLRTTHSSLADLESFLHLWAEQTHITWRVTKTDPKRMSGGLRNLYWAQFHCQNSNVQVRRNHPQIHSKHVGCEAKMRVTVKKLFNKINKRSRSKDFHLPDYPTIIRLEGEHNHERSCPENLRLQDVAIDVQKKFTELFKNGHSPLSAFEMHKYDLQMQYGEDYFAVAADRSQCPDTRWCYRMYHNMRNPKITSIVDLVPSLSNKCTEFNNSGSREFLKIDTSNDEIVIAVCTPLMHRVHQLWPYSREIVFVDSTNDFDKRIKFKVTSLLTNGVVGGLPLGIVITLSDSEQCIKRGVELLQEMVGDKGFFGNGALGPKLILSEDSTSLQQALTECFPTSVRMLCAFKFLQSMWRYLWNPRHNVPFDYKEELYILARNIVNAEDLQSMEKAYNLASSNSLVKEYDGFLSQLNDLWEKREMWAIDRREGTFETNGICKKNFSDIALRVLTENVFYRLKRFNIIQLLDFVLTRLDSFYERRLLDVTSCETDGLFLCKNLESDEDLTNADVIKTGEFEFIVLEKNTNLEFIVDRSVGMCSCTTGLAGGYCTHRYAVDKLFSDTLTNESLEDHKRNSIFREIAIGTSDNQLCLPSNEDIIPEVLLDTQFINSISNEEPSSVVQIIENAEGETIEIITNPEDSSSLDGAVVYLSVEEFLNRFNVDHPSDVDNPVDSKFYTHATEVIQSSEVSNIADTNNLEPDVIEDVHGIREQESILTSLDELFKNYKSKLLSSPKEYGPALKTFINNAKILKTDGELVSALKSFGKLDSSESLGASFESMNSGQKEEIRSTLDLQKTNPCSVPEYGYSKAKRKTAQSKFVPLKALKIIR